MAAALSSLYACLALLGERGGHSDHRRARFGDGGPHAAFVSDGGRCDAPLLWHGYARLCAPLGSSDGALACGGFCGEEESALARDRRVCQFRASVRRRPLRLRFFRRCESVALSGRHVPCDASILSFARDHGGSRHDDWQVSRSARLSLDWHAKLWHLPLAVSRDLPVSTKGLGSDAVFCRVGDRRHLAARHVDGGVDEEHRQA